MTQPLPPFVAPMLAKLGKPFDSDDYCFEIKWDGIRALTFRDADALSIRSRNNHELGPRYPELECLQALPAGTILDGELVAFVGDRPSFSKVLSREQARDLRGVNRLVREIPIHYVVFDILYSSFDQHLQEPWFQRRERLRQLLTDWPDPRIVCSDEVRGSGCAFFEQALERELEGIVAKRRNSEYLPGRRTDAWIKIKRRNVLHCLVLGYLESADRGLKSLLVAADLEGEVRYVGRVGSGLTDSQRETLVRRLRPLHRAQSLVPCPEPGIFVEPQIYCTVSYLEMTDAGMLRAPVLVNVEEDPVS